MLGSSSPALWRSNCRRINHGSFLYWQVDYCCCKHCLGISLWESFCCVSARRDKCPYCGGTWAHRAKFCPHKHSRLHNMNEAGGNCKAETSVVSALHMELHIHASMWLQHSYVMQMQVLGGGGAGFCNMPLHPLHNFHNLHICPSLQLHLQAIQLMCGVCIFIQIDNLPSELWL